MGVDGGSEFDEGIGSGCVDDGVGSGCGEFVEGVGVGCGGFVEGAGAGCVEIVEGVNVGSEDGKSDCAMCDAVDEDAVGGGTETTEDDW